MMTTSSVNSNSAVNDALKGGSSSAADLQNNFLKMLVTQMNNQDPLNPMDNAQLTSQLAQISTVSGLQTMNETLTALLSQTAASRAMDSANLIGKTVMVPGNAITVADGVATKIGVDVPSTADSVTVQVLDKNGNVVRNIDMKGQTAGVHDIAWDGKNDQGNAGQWRVHLQGVRHGRGQGCQRHCAGLRQGPVHQRYSTGVLVELGDGKTANVDDVRRIS